MSGEPMGDLHHLALTQRTQNTLRAYRIYTIAELRGTDEMTLRAIRGIGAASLTEISIALHRHARANVKPIPAILDAAKTARCRYDAVRARNLDAAADATKALADAARELIDAQAHYDAVDSPGGARWDRLAAARVTLAAALAPFEGDRA